MTSSEFIQPSLIQWIDEGLSCEAGISLDELTCVAYLAWHVVGTVAVCSLQWIYYLPPCLRVKQYTKKSQKMLFPCHISLPKSQEFQNSFRGFPFSIHQLFSGVGKGCLWHGALSYPIISALFLPAALLLWERPVTSQGPFTGPAETLVSVLPVSCSSGPPGNAFRLYLHFHDSSYNSMGHLWLYEVKIFKVKIFKLPHRSYFQLSPKLFV